MMKHYTHDFYDSDPLRGTGRTTRMINEAVIKFLDGFNVIVTAIDMQYSLDLQRKVCYILECQRVSFTAKKQVITIDGRYMVFTKHFNSNYNMFECRYISHFLTYLLFEDHFKGRF